MGASSYKPSMDISLCYQYCTRFYHSICILATLSLVAWCISLYKKDYDVSKVDYRNFHATEHDVYPSFSLCFGDVLLENKLHEYGVNKSLYLDFLKGIFWDKRLMGIDYENVSINPIDYMIGIEMY